MGNSGKFEPGPFSSLKMKVTELLNELDALGVDTRAIYTGDGNPEDRYAIVKAGIDWHVYYSERGEKLEFGQFMNETKACEYLKGLLLKDRTVWRNN